MNVFRTAFIPRTFARAMSTRIQLSDGNSMPALGLGTWQAEPGQVKEAVKKAIQVGYRHIDGAAFYMNEVEVGEGVKEAIDKHGLKREDLFIASKCWMSHLAPEHIESALKKTLSDLKLDYLDLYMAHFPCAMKYDGANPLPRDEDERIVWNFDVSPTQSYQAMEELVKKGLIKSLGVSNMNMRQLKDILKNSSIKPVSNQIESHPYYARKEMLQLCQDNKVVLVAYSPLGSPTNPFGNPERKMPLNDEMMIKIAKKHGKDVAQIALKWQIQRGCAVIPKSVTASRITSNFQVFDFTLSDDDMKAIDALDKGTAGRVLIPMLDDTPDFGGHPHFPFKEE